MALLRRVPWRHADILLMLQEFRTGQEELVASVVLYTDYQSTGYGSSRPWRIATPAREEWQEAEWRGPHSRRSFSSTTWAAPAGPCVQSGNSAGFCQFTMTLQLRHWTWVAWIETFVPASAVVCYLYLGMVLLPLLGNLWISSPGEQCEVY